MKKNKIILMALSLSCAAFTACNDDYQEKVGNTYIVQPQYYALTASNQLYFNNLGGTESDYVTAAGTDWKLTPAANWLKISPTQGKANSTAFEQNPQEIVYTAEENKEAGSNRIAVNMLESTNSAWKYTLPVTVSQSPAPAYIEAKGETSFNVSGKGATFNISFDTNDEWTMYADNVDWLSVQEPTGKGSRTNLKVYIAPNNQGYARNNTLYVRCNSYSSLQAVYSIYQAESGIEIKDVTKLTLDNSATQTTFKINADAEWTTAVDNSSRSWLSISPASGEAGETTITMTAAENTGIDSRYGYVQFYIGSQFKASIEIEQRGIYLNVAGSTNESDQPIIRLSSSSYTANVSIEANAKWKAEIDPTSKADDWLSISPTSGEGTATLQLQLKDNPNTIGRSAVVRFYVGDSYATAIVRRSILVMQSGKSISLDKQTLNFDDDAATLKVNLKAEGPWTATTNSDWITLNAQSGTTDATLSVTVTENKDDKNREGLVMVTMADKTIDLTVAQRGKMMMLDDAPLKFGSTGGKGDIYIITNDKWTATVEDSPSWIQLNPTSGEDSAHVAVTVLSNNYLKERSTHVTIASAYGKKFVVPIQQSMRYLTANVSSFTFLGNGGQQGPLLIKCDGQYSIKNSSAWLTLTKDETSGGYLLYTTPNTGQKQRTDTIVVACTDLLEGKLELKIPVRQVSNVTDLTLTGYSVDGNWNVISAGGFTVTMTGYKTDKDWNPTNGDQEAFTIKRKNYGNDQNWNK